MNTEITANLSDETLLSLVDMISITLAERKQKAEDTKKNRITISISIGELEACWNHGCRGDKIYHVEKYRDENNFYFVGTLKAKHGGEQVILGCSRMFQYNVFKVNCLPTNVILVPNIKGYNRFKA